MNSTTEHAHSDAIGLLGGTFDPIHKGHLHIALQAYQNLPLSQIAFMPCYQPVHKHAGAESAAHRLAMLSKAITPYPMLTSELCEIKSKTPCYTIDTLAHLYQRDSTQPLCFLVGMDALCQLTRWHRWQALTDYAHWVILSRPGYERALSEYDNTLQSWLTARLTQNKAAITRPITEGNPGVVLFQTISPCSVSASHIRAQLATGQSCEKDLPSDVWQYILEHKLYKGV